jgi:hypothetical protein
MSGGIQQPNVIDLITYDPRHDEVILVIVEEKAFNGDSKLLFQLQNKINLYLSFILDGHLEKQYPSMKDKPVRIRLDCSNELSEEIRAFMIEVKKQIVQYKISLEIDDK